MPEQHPAGWFPDPFGRHQHRYWNGEEWTHHVGDRGEQSVDPPVPGPPAPATQDTSRAAWAEPHATSDSPGSSPQAPFPSATPTWGASQPVSAPGPASAPRLLTEPILVVSQKAKVFSSNVDYAIKDQHGARIGAVREVGRGVLRKQGDRLRGASQSNRRYKLELVDASGMTLISMIRPGSTWKSKMTVTSGTGVYLGQIAQENIGVFRKVRFRLESNGRSIGSIHAENYSAWDFRIDDANGTEVARITKEWAGFLKERFTRADNYVVEIHRPLQEPLRSLVVAAATAVDVAIKQGDPSSTRYR